MFSNKDPKHNLEMALIFIVLGLLLLIWVLIIHSSAEEAPPVKSSGFQMVDPPPLTGQLLYETCIYNACEEFGFEDVPLIFGIVETESNWDPNAVSAAGAIGLMQIVPRYSPDLLQELGVTNLLDPQQNIRVGVKLMKNLVENYSGDEIAALMYYNEGYFGQNKYFKQGIVSAYATKVLNIAQGYREEDPYAENRSLYLAPGFP